MKFQKTKGIKVYKLKNDFRKMITKVKKKIEEDRNLRYNAMRLALGEQKVYGRNQIKKKILQDFPLRGRGDLGRIMKSRNMFYEKKKYPLIIKWWVGLNKIPTYKLIYGKNYKSFGFRKKSLYLFGKAINKKDWIIITTKNRLKSLLIREKGKFEIPYIDFDKKKIKEILNLVFYELINRVLKRYKEKLHYLKIS